MNALDVTVIIPTRGRAELLARAMRSALAQTVPPQRIIVVEDDGPTEASHRVVEAASAQVTVDYLASTGGAARARNVGLQSVETQYVALLDDDDWWRPAFLERCAETLRSAGPGFAVLVGLRIVTADGEADHIPTLRPAQECFYRNGGFTGQNAVFETSALCDIGGYDPQLRALQDRDLQLRLLHAGVKFLRIDEPLAIIDQSHRLPRISTSDARADGLIQFYRKWAGEAPWPIKAHMAIRALVAQRQSSSSLRRTVGATTFHVVRGLEGIRELTRANARRRNDRSSPAPRGPRSIESDEP